MAQGSLFSRSLRFFLFFFLILNHRNRMETAQNITLLLFSRNGQETSTLIPVEVVSSRANNKKLFPRLLYFPALWALLYFLVWEIHNTKMFPSLFAAPGHFLQCVYESGLWGKCFYYLGTLFCLALRQTWSWTGLRPPASTPISVHSRFKTGIIRLLFN